MNKNLDSIIRKIEALITQADHPNTSPTEAETFRAKAEAMMFKYRIEEMQLNASGEANAPAAVLPQWADFTLCPDLSEYRHFYRAMFSDLLRHFDARANYVYRVDAETGRRNLIAEVVGYESDLSFIRVMWQSIRLGFGSKLEPKYDPAQSDEENCYRMRAAGMEGVRIAYAVFGDGKKSNCVKARKLARKWAKANGLDAELISGHGMQTYRESFANGFAQEMYSRLRSMARSRAISDAGSLVLASRKENVDEAFYTKFPDRRPKPQVESAVPSSWDEQRKCPKCAKAKSGYCREHGWMRPRAGKARAFNHDAAAVGASAARSVNLGVTNREVN